MKTNFQKILLLFCASLSINIASAQSSKTQNEGFFYLLEAGAMPRMGDVEIEDQKLDSDGGGTTFRATAGYYLNPHFSLGLGIGTDNFREPSISTLPLFADVRAILKTDGSSPFAFYKLGYSFKIGDGIDQGVINNIGLGYRFAVGNNYIVPAIGYHLLNFETTSSTLNPQTGETTENNIEGSINSLSITIGFQF